MKVTKSPIQCPFCGHHVIKIWPDSDPEIYNNVEYYAECQHCFAQGPMSHSEEEALNQWNTRK